MADPELSVLALCAGGGGLERGLKLALPTARTVCWVEWDAFAANYLCDEMEAGRLDPAPVWTDLRTFDGLPWRGTVDCVTAGYPCQPFSQAGRRDGHDDPRHLWPEVYRVVQETRPALVFLENVAGHVSLGLGTVLGDLDRAGYRATATLVQAATVGAPHQRERVFILAVADDDQSERKRERADEREPDTGPTGRDDVGGRSTAHLENPTRVEPTPGRRGRRVRETGHNVADAGRVGNERRGGPRDIRAAAARAQVQGDKRERSGDTVDASGFTAFPSRPRRHRRLGRRPRPMARPRASSGLHPQRQTSRERRAG